MDKSSLSRQRDECLSLAMREGFTVPDSLVFQDVMSGRRDDRPAYLEMLEAARHGKFSRLYIWTIDRIGRTLRGAVNAVGELRELGVVTVSAKEGAMDEPVRLAVLSAIAERELERFRERTRPAKILKRAAGAFISGKEPFGYRKRDDKSLEKCPVEAQVVRRIIIDCIGGLGRTAIARALNSEGVPPPEIVVTLPGGSQRRIRPGHFIADHGPGGFAAWCQEAGATFAGVPSWGNSSVMKIIKSPAACGRLNTRLGDEVVLRIHGGPITSESEWRDAQRALASRIQKGRAGDKSKWLLTGILTCGECGSHYRHINSKGTPYYACNGRKSGKPCPGPYIKGEIVESIVIGRLRDHLAPTLGDLASVEEVLFRQGRIDRAELERRIEEGETALAAADGAWSLAQRAVENAIEAGISLTSVPAVARRVNDTRSERDLIARDVSALRDQAALLDASMRTSALDIERVARRIVHATHLAHADADGEVEILADIRFVIHELITSAVVHSDRSVDVEIDDSPATLFRLFTRLMGRVTGDERLEQTIADHL